MTPSKMESKDIGFTIGHDIRFWTTPKRNANGDIVNILNNRDVLLRYIFDLQTKKPIRELGRFVMIDMNYSLGPGNQILHMEWSTQQANPAIDKAIYALPNGL